MAEAMTPTDWPAVRLAAVKVGVKGRPVSETNCGVMAKTVEEEVSTVKRLPVAVGLTAWPRPCMTAILKLPEATERTGPLSRLTGGWPAGGGGASWMRVAR